MSLKARQKEAFRLLGLTTEEYYIDSVYPDDWPDGDTPVLPPIWGTAIQRDGVDVAVIETHASHTDDPKLRNRYILKKQRGLDGTVISIHKLKREALAAYARMCLRAYGAPTTSGTRTKAAS